MNLTSWEGYVLLLLVIWYLSHQAGRLDRLHHRIEMTSAALDSHLGRRAGIVAELATSPMIDPVTAAVFAQSAHDALAVEPHELMDRLDVETALSEVLFESLDDAEELEEWRSDATTRELLDELSVVCARISLSSNFYAAAVADCLNIRTQWIVRLFRLAGYAQLPTDLNLDSRIPPALAD
ncbi:MAG: hypothetical protein EBR84_01860 [Actinobacteria bacterium]|nr:hypothetical protein [Actinomycetota bacterium]